MLWLTVFENNLATANFASSLLGKNYQFLLQSFI
jgi:hypothetical protein